MRTLALVLALLLIVSLCAPASSFTIRWIWQEGVDGVTNGFVLYRSTVRGGPYERVATLQAWDRSYVDSGIVGGTWYYWVATSFWFRGNESPYSNEVSGCSADVSLIQKILAFFKLKPVPVPLCRK